MRHLDGTLCALVVLLLVGCGGGSGAGSESSCFDDPQQWGINFYFDGVFFTRTLITMEATRNLTKGRIEIDVPGCELAWLFDMQFSGSQVRLLNFTVASDSTCSPVLLQTGTGTGTADAAYGDATEVRESTTTGTLRYLLGGNSVGGDFTWNAVLCPI